MVRMLDCEVVEAPPINRPFVLVVVLGLVLGRPIWFPGRGRPRGRLSSWLRFTSGYWRCSLSMNRVPSAGFGLENHVVLACELLEQALFSLSHFRFIFLEPLFDVSDTVNHQAPEQFGQLARQRQVGHQPAFAALEPSIKPTEGFVDTPSHAPRHHAKQPSRPIARTALAASAFATISAARRQSQPRREVLL